MLGFLYFSVVGIAVALAIRRRLLRLRKGDEPRCRKCEYDLTGNVTGRCPECGGLLLDVGVQKGTPALSGRARRIVDLVVLVVVLGVAAGWLLLALVLFA